MFDLMPLGNRENSIWSYMDNLEKSFFQGLFPQGAAFRTDIADQGGQYLLTAELPGMERQDIDIQVEADRLVIAASHQEEKEEKEENYIRRERRVGSYKRSFDLTGIDAEKISAKYENGILSLALPKKVIEPQAAARKISIE